MKKLFSFIIVLSIVVMFSACTTNSPSHAEGSVKSFVEEKGYIVEKIIPVYVNGTTGGEYPFIKRLLAQDQKDSLPKEEEIFFNYIILATNTDKGKFLLLVDSRQDTLKIVLEDLIELKSN